MMRAELLSKFPELSPLSLTTVSVMLKKGLHYTFHKVGTRPLVVDTDRFRDKKLDFCKCFLFMRSLNVEMIFIDEYSMQ